jgi:hypothetical protein
VIRNHLLALVLPALVSAGCGDSSQSTTAPSTTTPSTATELFVGALAPMGSGFYSFTVSQAGTVGITLVSVTSGSRVPVPAAVVGLGFGVPSGTGCGTTTSLNTTAALSAQITNSSAAGIYCVEIHDLGNLTDAVTFVIRIVHT